MLTKISNLLSLQRVKCCAGWHTWFWAGGQAGSKGRTDASVLSSKENYLES